MYFTWNVEKNSRYTSLYVYENTVVYLQIELNINVINPLDFLNKEHH